MAAVNINQEQFNRLIAGEKPVLVDFWAPWCTYCRRISDAYDRIAQEYADRLEVVKVNIDDNEALAIQEKIEIIPTLVIYRGGKAAASIVAPESKAMIEGFIGDLLPQEEEKESRQVHDMVIVGGGPGGYTAALYAARSGLDTLVIEKLSAGGQMAQTHQIDNYPGFEEGIDGYELAGRMQRQAHRFGAKTVYAEVDRIDLAPDVKRLETSEGIFYGKTVVLAMGASPRPLGVEKEQELTGRGVAYCAASYTVGGNAN